jgi:predicted MFS family arabinose efflux permease
MRPILFPILPFLAGYFLSYFLRTVNAVIAPELTRELGLSAADLGRLTSAYFLTFAIAQLPVGLLLDRYGPRRTESGLLLLTALGTLGFALGQGDTALALARGVMGLGVSACLMAALKYSSQLLPPERQAGVTGLIMAAGGLGAVTSSAPLEMMLPYTGWRPVFLFLALISLVVAVYMFRSVRDIDTGLHQQTLAQQLQGLRAVLSKPVFWLFAPAAAFSTGGFMAIQGLWAVPWLMHVHELARADAARYQLVLCLAGLLGQLAIAAFATRLMRRGIGQLAIMIAGLAVTIGAQAAILVFAGQSYLAWFAFGAAASTGAQIYSLLASRYVLGLSGRVMTSINLIVFVGAFLVQWGYGVLVDLGAATLGAADAYRLALAVLVALQGFALLMLGLTRQPSREHRMP